MRAISAFFVLAVSLGCATTPAAQQVRLERVRNSADFLAFRHDVEARCTLLSHEKLGSDGGPGSRRNAREYAVKIGADTVIWREYNDSEDGLSHADFYRCR